MSTAGCIGSVVRTAGDVRLVDILCAYNLTTPAADLSCRVCTFVSFTPQSGKGNIFNILLKVSYVTVYQYCLGCRFGSKLLSFPSRFSIFLITPHFFLFLVTCPIIGCVQHPTYRIILVSKQRK